MIATVLLFKSLLILLGQKYAFGQAVFQNRTAKYAPNMAIFKLQALSYSENLKEFLNTYSNYVPWKEGIQVGVLILCIIYIIYQIQKFKRNDKEFEAKRLISNDHDKTVQRVREFYDDTDQSFMLFEINSNVLKQRFNKYKMANDDDNNALARKGVECVQKSWDMEYELFQKMKIGQIDRINKVSDNELKAQLTMTKGFVDKEILKMRKIMAEDKLSYKEIKADVTRLQKYFSIHKPKRTLAHVRNV